MKRVVAFVVVIALVGVIIWRCRGGESTPVVSDAAVAPPLTKARIKLRDLQRQKPGTVRGKVTANNGPVANALVCSRPSDDVDDVRCEATNGAGVYELRELRPAAYQLWASANGFAGRALPDKLTLKAGEGKSGIDFVLPLGDTELVGRVRDTHGKLLTNALVHVRVGGDPIATTHTDPFGEFRVWVDGNEATVEATAEGYVDASLNTAVPATGVELVLLPEATLSGIVVEADTKTPVADANVTLDGTRLTSGDDGTFRARKLNPGRYKPTASSIGGYGEATESVLLRVGSHVDGVVIEVHPVAVVAGRIVIEGTDKGCPENQGNVMLERRGSRELAFGRTILDGDVLIEGVVPGIYAVQLGCVGHLAKVYPDIVVGGSDVEDLVWPVTPGGKLVGRVRTKTGDLVKDAAVTVDAGFVGTGARVSTGADGMFEAIGLSAGAVTVEAIQIGYAKSEEVKTTVSFTSENRVELVLGDKTGSIVGTVTDRAGAPVAHARVEVRSSGNDTSDLHGAFEISGLEPGVYDVVVESKWQLSSSETRTLTPPGHAPVRVRVDRGVATRVQLQVDREDSKITGIVVDERGAPVADVAIDIALTSPDLESQRRRYERTLAWTSSTGTFEISGIPAELVAVRARIDGANEVVADNVHPGQHVRMVLESTGMISGVVTDPSGASVDDITLEIEDRAQDISRRERLFHTGGKFTFRELPVGTYRLTADEDRRTSVTVTVARGDRREGLQLALRPRHAIKGRLVDATGKPLPNYRIEVPHKQSVEHNPKGGTVTTFDMEESATDARGEFFLQGIVGAEVTISASSRLAGPHPKMVELKTIPLVGPPTIDVGDLVLPKPEQ